MGLYPLAGEHSEEGGHHITVWAPRQTGKSSVMLEVLKRLKKENQFEVAIMTMQSAKSERTAEGVLALFLKELQHQFDQPLPKIAAWKELPDLFTSQHFTKPLILIVDEFDALDNEFINSFANELRKIFTDRLNQIDRKSYAKTYILHGLALIGVRSVPGIENTAGSPFNIQRSLHIPNLTLDEVKGMFVWYEQESRHHIEPAVIERLYYETQGHPGLTCWFGELLTEGYETYQVDTTRPATVKDFERVYAAATALLPNNTILNLISKAKQPPYRALVLELFKTEDKLIFTYDDEQIKFLYLNGVIDSEVAGQEKYYVKFSCPFVQKRLFYYFPRDVFHEMGRLVDPFDSLEDAITENSLSLPNLLTRYQAYLRKNGHWLFKNAPRREDLHIREAVYHFNLYMYLHKFLHTKGARVWPEFPTGNGQFDLLITYRDTLYGIEIKSFSNVTEYKSALTQAARYGHTLGLTTITLVFFIDSIDKENRDKFEVEFVDPATGVTVRPAFIETGM